LFLYKLVALSTPFRSLQNEIPVLERGQDISGFYSIAGTNGSFPNKAVKWGHGRPLHFPFEDRLCSHAVLAFSQG
jgi:hypothetical protein